MCGVRVSGGKGCYPIGKLAVGPSLVFTEGLVVGSFGVCFGLAVGSSIQRRQFLIIL